MKKPTVIILNAPKGKKLTRKEYSQRHYRTTPPAERQPEHPEAKIGAIELAKRVLKDRLDQRNDAYFLDGKLVSIVKLLQAANDQIARENLTLPKKRHTPLIGTKHHRWGQ